MSELLLEVLSEEIPAKMQAKGVRDFCDMVIRHINAAMSKVNVHWKDVDASGACCYVTPRRVALVIKDIDITHQEQYLCSQTQEIRGPRTDAASNAVNGFMCKYGVCDMSDLIVKDGHFVYIRKQFSDVKRVLAEAIEAALCNFVWPKSMCWGGYEIRWVRPIHSILCLLDDTILPVRFGHIVSGNTTLGHKFLAPNTIVINNASEYEKKLSNSFVVCDRDERKSIILRDVQRALSELHLTVIDDADLLEELAGLVEFPVVLVGQIESKFMKLPYEVLKIVLREHQKFLLTRDINGNVAPYFVIVSNIQVSDESHIINGNVRVLRARLTDAEFFLNLDRKISLEARINMLHKIAFHHEIGNMYDKTMRVVELSKDIAQCNDVEVKAAERCALLAKCDLITNMVNEFPELQGVMGSYYAMYDGEEESVVCAIAEQYKPQGHGDNIPRTKLGAVLAVADKLDTLRVMFEHGIRPTGSKDPYALRRAALGVIRIVEHYGLSINLMRHAMCNGVMEFLAERLNYWDKAKDNVGVRERILSAFTTAG